MKNFQMLIFLILITFVLYVDFTPAQLGGSLKNSTGGSSFSPPPIPNFTVTPGIRKNLIEWTGDYDIIKIYRDETSPPTTLVYTLTSGTSQLDTPLVAGTTYYYRVTGSEYNTLTSEYSSIVGAVPEDVSTIDPATLSPTAWLDESERANNSWGDKLSAKGFGDGGATSYYPFTQNGLTYYESDESFTPFFIYDTGFLIAPNQSFSFVMLYKTKATGTSTNQRIFYQSSDDPEATWGINRVTDIKAQYRISDDVGNQMSVVSADAINDNAWRIIVMTVKQATNAGELIVYQSTGEKLTDTDASWVLSNYDASREGTFLNGGGGTNSTWTGTAEIIYFQNKILTLEEANGVGAWLADKWAVTWTDNE